MSTKNVYCVEDTRKLGEGFMINLNQKNTGNATYLVSMLVKNIIYKGEI